MHVVAVQMAVYLTRYNDCLIESHFDSWFRVPATHHFQFEDE